MSNGTYIETEIFNELCSEVAQVFRANSGKETLDKVWAETRKHFIYPDGNEVAKRIVAKTGATADSVVRSLDEFLEQFDQFVKLAYTIQQFAAVSPEFCEFMGFSGASDDIKLIYDVDGRVKKLEGDLKETKDYCLTLINDQMERSREADAIRAAAPASAPSITVQSAPAQAAAKGGAKPFRFKKGKDYEGDKKTWGQYANQKALLENVGDSLYYGAGTDEDWYQQVAALLVAAQQLHYPLALIGPNAFEIAESFSVALYGRHADVLDCGSEWSPRVLGKIAEEERITTIQNAFTPAWESRVPQLLMSAKTCPILIAHCPEDVALEPESLWGCAFPVLTEHFTSDTPDLEYIPNTAGKDFKAPGGDSKPSRPLSSSIKEFGLPLWRRGRYEDLLTLFTDNMKLAGLADDRIADAICTLGFLPLARLSGAKEPLEKTLKAFDIKDDRKKELIRFAGF